MKVELESEKQSLEETEFDRYINQQEELLSSLYDEYENILNTRLDDTNALISDVITEVNTNATTISDTLTAAAGTVGTSLSSAMTDIWGENGSAKSVLTTYGDKITGTEGTTLHTTLNGIKQGVYAMVADKNKDAKTNVGANKTTTSAEKNPIKNTIGTALKQVSNKIFGKGDGKAKVGDKVKFVSGKYYYDSQGKTPLGSKNLGKQVYITKINPFPWATHPYHISTGSKLGKGDLGWLKLNQLSGYATGKKNFLNSEVAWTQENGQEYIVRPSDGAILTPIAKGDSVLTSAASNNIWDMANSPAEFIKDNLKLSTANVPNNSNVQNNITQNLDKVVFNLPNVRNYEQLLAEMQRDKSFEKLILSMTIDKIAGKSSLAKNKSIR